MVDFLIFLAHTMPFSVALLTIHFTLGWILLVNLGLQRQVRFPQISELAVGPAAAKMLYRQGSKGLHVLVFVMYLYGDIVQDDNSHCNRQ